MSGSRPHPDPNSLPAACLAGAAETPTKLTSAECLPLSERVSSEVLAAAEARGAGLAAVIEGEVIPRLLMLHRNEPSYGFTRPMPKSAMSAEAKPAARAAPVSPGQLTAKHVADLTELVRRDAYSACQRYVMALRDKGHPPSQLLADLLAPVARQLGEMWTDDEADFVEVTLGTSHLQRLLSEIREPIEADMSASPNLLLTVVPGEQHTFGLLVAADAFIRAGINVVTLIPRDFEELAAASRLKRYDCIGFSLGSESLIKALGSAIEAVRRDSEMRSLPIVVGGPVVGSTPDLLTGVPSVCVADDVPKAVAYLMTTAQRGIEPA